MTQVLKYNESKIKYIYLILNFLNITSKLYLILY